MADAEEADRLLPDAVKRSLRQEATSLNHLLRHKPRNPYCEACVRGKMKGHRKFKGSFKNSASFWGQHLTADHITSQKENMLGVTGDRDALVVKDLYSGLKHLYPTADKSAKTTEASLRHFIGDRMCRKLYSDNSGEIGAALKKLKIMPHNSPLACPRLTRLQKGWCRTSWMEPEQH